MATPRRRGRPRFVLAVLVLIAITVITVYYRGHGRSLVSSVKSLAHDVVDPVGHLVAAMAHPVEHFIQGAADYGSLSSANARLRQENARLRAELGSASVAQSEANQLKAQLGLPYLQGMPTVPADVVSDTPSDFESSIEIDRGSSSGVASGMPVVSGGGLVGIVVQVSRSTAVVQLVTDSSTKIAVRFDAGPPRGPQVAVVDGEGSSNPLKAEYVDPHDHLTKGEILVSSGLAGGTLPPDVPVGRVRSVSAGSSAPQLDVTVSPLVDLANLQYVSVVEWEPSP